MIIRWGRKGLLAGALTAAFVTPVVAPVSNTLHEVQHRPSFKQEVRHVTPGAEAPTANSIKKAQLRPDIKLEYRYLTPVISEAEISDDIGGGYDNYLLQAHQEDEELLLILTSFFMALH